MDERAKHIMNLIDNKNYMAELIANANKRKDAKTKATKAREKRDIDLLAEPYLKKLLFAYGLKSKDVDNNRELLEITKLLTQTKRILKQKHNL